MSVFDDSKDQDAAFLVLSRLAQHGIKNYAIKFCDHTETSVDIVDKIFDKIIFKKLNHDYANTTTYVNHNTNTNDTDYKSKVFNTTDLICLIFLFSQCHNNDSNSFIDLYNKSLVCSHWLYHAFNPNTMYHVPLHRLLWKKSSTARSQLSQLQLPTILKVVEYGNDWSMPNLYPLVHGLGPHQMILY